MDPRVDPGRFSVVRGPWFVTILACLSLARVVLAESSGESIRGVWLLDSDRSGSKETREEGWAFAMTFEDDGLFLVNSSQEVADPAAGASPASNPRRIEVRLMGTYLHHGLRLELKPRQPLGAEATKFARAHFGVPRADGSHEVAVTVAENFEISVPATGRRLSFRRPRR